MRTLIRNANITGRKPALSVVLVRDLICEDFEPLSFAVSERQNKRSHVFTQDFPVLHFFFSSKFNFSFLAIRNRNKRGSIYWVTFLLECTLLLQVIFIIEMLTNLFFKLTQVRTKDLIELWVVASKTYWRQLFFREIILKLRGIYWITIIILVLYHVEWFDWDLSDLAMLYYQEHLVFDENDGLFASKAFKECEHASRFAVSIYFTARIQRRVFTKCIADSPCIWLKWYEYGMFINNLPKAFQKVFEVDVVHNTFLDFIECFECRIDLCLKHGEIIS